MKNEKILTIVTSCYNSTATVLNTLKSLDINKHKQIDIFLIDDGSKDNLKECVKKYLQLYPNQVHYFRKKNGNWGSCLNYAIKRAKTRFLAVLDSDDLYNSKTLTKVLKLLKKVKTETDLVFCNYEFHYLDMKKHKVKEIEKITVSHANKDIKYIPIKKLPLYHLITIHSTIFATKLLKKLKPLIEGVSFTDNLLIYEALQKAKVLAYLNKKLFLYKYFIRSGQQTISIETCIKKYGDFEAVFNQMLALPIDMNDKKQIRISKRFISIILYWIAQVLGKDYSKTKLEKIKLVKKYTDQITELEKKLDCGHQLEGILYPGLKHYPMVTLRLIKTSCAIVNSSFIKATNYDKENKKWAKLIAKLRRKAQKENHKK